MEVNNWLVTNRLFVNRLVCKAMTNETDFEIKTILSVADFDDIFDWTGGRHRQL